MAWNGSSGGSTPTVKPAKKAGKTSPALKGALAGLLVIAGAVTAFFYLMPSEKPVAKAEQPKKTSKIREVQPHIVTNAPDLSVKPGKPKKHPMCDPNRPIPPEVKRDKNGILRWPNGARWIRDYNFQPGGIDIYADQKKLFKCGSDVHIATLLKLKPGQMIISGFQYGERFDRDFKKSLDQEIEFADDDTPEERQLKEDVIAVRKDLKEAMDRGEKPSELMQESREELIKLFQYKHDLQIQLDAIKKNPDINLQDQIDAYEAANKMLEEKGIADKFPIKSLLFRQAHNIK